jgi:hypothetical protein
MKGASCSSTGIEGITSFDVGGSASYLSVRQEDDLKAWVGAAPPRSTRQIGSLVEKEFGLVYESRSGLIALLHRLGLECHEPRVIPALPLQLDRKPLTIAWYATICSRPAGAVGSPSSSMAIPSLHRRR